MAVGITQTANPAGVDAVANVSTYTDAAIGTASVDRLVVVVVGKEVATTVLNAVTIGEVVAALAGGTTFGNVGTWMYFAPIPAGTTATILVTWSGAILGTQNHIAVYAVTDAAGPPATGTHTSTDMDAGTPLSTGSSTIPTNGAMLAAASCAADNTTHTWANLTGDINADAGAFQFQTAMSTTAGAATRTLTGSTNQEDGVLVWGIFSQTVLPTNALLIMPTMVPPVRPV